MCLVSAEDKEEEGMQISVTHYRCSYELRSKSFFTCNSLSIKISQTPMYSGLNFCLYNLILNNDRNQGEEL